VKQGLKIAVSGRSGCGNTTVSRMVAQALGFRLINYTFHTMADEMGIPFRELCRLAEEDPQYDYTVDERQIAMTEGGDCVLGSRLAIWLCKDADLKVFLTAPPEVRAGRIRSREGGDPELVLKETLARDDRDHRRYLKLYGIDNEEFGFADMVVPTEKYGPEEICRMIVERARNIR